MPPLYELRPAFLGLLFAAFAAVLGVALALGYAGCDASSDEAAVLADASAVPPDTAALPLALPTDNLGLLTGDLAGFYQAVDRDTVAGLRTAGWEGGQYGFVRGPVGSGTKKRFIQLHEGLDIRPLHRDADGEPLDVVYAAMRGHVAYVNESPGSAYGRYVVLEHDWGGVPVYTLYAHLDSVGVTEGERVGRRQPLGRLGYTGRGINRERAHVHFEVALMLNEHEPRWFERYYGGQADLHGRFFGTNLAGVDVPALFEALRRNPTLPFSEFVRGQPAAYRIAIPADRPLDLLRRYPWLFEGTRPPGTGTGSWEVTFTREGVPIRVGWAAQAGAQPGVVWVHPEIAARRLGTNGLLVPTEGGYVLTGEGLRYLSLVATTAEGPPGW